MAGDGESPFRYHLELTPEQLKVTHTALRALRDDFGHDEAEVHALVEEVLAKLPDDHAIRAIQLGRENQAAAEILSDAPAPAEPTGELRPAPSDDGSDEPPPTVA